MIVTHMHSTLLETPQCNMHAQCCMSKMPTRSLLTFHIRSNHALLSREKLAFYMTSCIITCTAADAYKQTLSLVSRSVLQEDGHVQFSREPFALPCTTVPSDGSPAVTCPSVAVPTVAKSALSFCKCYGRQCHRRKHKTARMQTTRMGKDDERAR